MATERRGGDFPEHFDEEDIELARKEWILAGCEVTTYLSEAGDLFTHVYDPKGDKYARYFRKDGIWLRVGASPASIKRRMWQLED